MSSATPSPSIRGALLTRKGLVFVASSGPRLPEATVRAFALELAALGYVPSTRLSDRLATASLPELTELRAWVVSELAAQLGADVKHEPLFRKFPQGIPDDTLDLWVRKVLVHFAQGADQPCLSCRRVGTTHVLEPCKHVVCDRCFDGASYSACPVCEHHVAPSPFFRPGERGEPRPKERVTFKLLDLGGDLAAEGTALFASLCSRTQALSPGDRAVLATIVRERGEAILESIPRAIPVRENVAVLFGTLLQTVPAARVLPRARAFLTTATDVLRLIAVVSGTDGSLQAQTTYRKVAAEPAEQARFWGKLAAMFGVATGTAQQNAYVPLQIRRFKVAKLPRPVRRALLEILEGLDPDRLVEDMLRHRSYWVWAGEFLHPGEYAARFPHVARAFAVVRKKAPDGTPAPPFATFYASAEAAASRRDARALADKLAERPGELARRLDLALRIADGPESQAYVARRFEEKLGVLATPVLVTLRSHLPRRSERAPARVYWPKGEIAMGVVQTDRRPLLPLELAAGLARRIDAELLRRFASKPAFAAAVVDDALGTVIAPFNERTATASAVMLPRGSTVATSLWEDGAAKIARVFVHWCEPEKGGEPTDLDLSVGFYDAGWQHIDVCSYYKLKATTKDGAVIAQSSGDLRDAPFPKGASEFVDLHCAPARAAGARYAVMVVNAYAGMPFGLLERAFAGIMFRDDAEGQHFDPRTVALKFALAGPNGVYLPLVFDLEQGLVHWLDVGAKGQIAFNNVATSNKDIARICPAFITYFGSGTRASIRDLGLLHAAARARRVFLRSGGELRELVRRPEEDAPAFFRRLVEGAADRVHTTLPEAGPLLAVLARGDLPLPKGSDVYALFREQLVPTLSASDLLS